MDKQIIDYTVVRSLDLAEMIMYVKDLIKKNYSPLGGISISDTRFTTAGFYCQAMVKYATDK